MASSRVASGAAASGAGTVVAAAMFSGASAAAGGDAGSAAARVRPSIRVNMGSACSSDGPLRGRSFAVANDSRIDRDQVESVLPPQLATCLMQVRGSPKDWAQAPRQRGHAAITANGEHHEQEPPQ